MTAGEIPLQTDQDDVRARQLVRQLCKEAGFSLVDQTKFVTAASELARNARIHGGGGVLRWEALADGGRVGIRLAFQDHGRGIPDVTQAMQDGWSSGDGLGLGLSGAKRLVSEFDLQTEPGKGTTVTVVRWR